MQRTFSRSVGMIWVLLGAACYGVVASVVKMSYADGYTGIQISAAQTTMGTLLAWLLAACRPRDWVNPLREPWWQLSLVGIFGLVLTTFFYYLALSRLDASLAIILLFQFTWITIVFDVVFRRKRPTRWQLGSAAVIVAGTVLAVGIRPEALRTTDLPGVLLGFSAAVTYSLFIYCTGRIETRMKPVQKSAVMMTAALPVIYVLYPPQVIFQAEAGGLLVWGLIAGLLGQVLPIIFFNAGIPRTGSTLASILASVELPVGMLCALWLLGEAIAPGQWLGMLVILGGIVLAERSGGDSG